MSENNDFEWGEFIEPLLSAMNPDADLNEEIQCARCKDTMLFKEGVPISYVDADGERHTFHICLKCFEPYCKQHDILERNFIKWFLGGGKNETN